MRIASQMAKMLRRAPVLSTLSLAMVAATPAVGVFGSVAYADGDISCDCGSQSLCGGYARWCCNFRTDECGCTLFVVGC